MDTPQIENILDNFGGTDINSLKDLLQDIENDFEIETIKASPYYTLENLPTDIRTNSSNLLVLSLNTQSILAKISSLNIMLSIYGLM